MKLCIFDLDGTLINTINTISYFANRALKKYGLREIPAERYKLLVGDGAKVLVERMLKETGADEALFEEVSREYNQAYDRDYLYLTKPYDGILELLRNLKGLGVKTAVLTNKPDDTAQKVVHTLFGDAIDLCVGKREGWPPKPDPKAALDILKQLGAAPEDCIYTGDTLTDMRTGKNAGLYTVGCLWGFRDLAELQSGAPDAIISAPHELLELVTRPALLV